MKAKSGFTLGEILIVVVILGILAAIVIPQFTEASTEAKNSSLMTDLQTMRSQIELFKIQHNDDLPGAHATTSFAEAMIGTTDIVGDSTGSDYGPYVQKIPRNQFNNSDVIVDGTATTIPVITDGSSGWYFNTDTGAFNASTTGHTDL